MVKRSASSSPEPKPVKKAKITPAKSTAAKAAVNSSNGNLGSKLTADQLADGTGETPLQEIERVMLEGGKTKVDSAEAESVV